MKGMNEKRKKREKRGQLTSVALPALAIRLVSAASFIRVDGLGVHLGAGLVDVVAVSDSGVPRVAGDSNPLGVFGSGKSAGGRRGHGKTGGEDEAGELHDGWWRVGWEVIQGF